MKEIRSATPPRSYAENLSLKATRNCRATVRKSFQFSVFSSTATARPIEDRATTATRFLPLPLDPVIERREGVRCWCWEVGFEEAGCRPKSDGQEDFGKPSRRAAGESGAAAYGRFR